MSQQLPPTHILHRQMAQTLPVAASAQGVFITDNQGRHYIDASGGAAVSCLGHGHPDVLAAVHAQLDRLAYAHTSFFTTQVAEELADLLVQDAPAGISHAYFVSGGSEAVEAALKMARQYFVETGQPQRRHFIARRQSYHGNTLGALAVGGNAWRRKQFAPLLIAVTHVAPCYAYRDRRADESAEAYGQRLVAELAAAIETLGGENVIAFVAETVGGATQGAVTPVPGYLRGVRELCTRHGILLILDEVMCGMGRCGTLHACEAEGVTPDLLVVAKGLGGGYQPIGAVLAQSRVVESFAKGSGAFQHGHTYIGHADGLRGGAGGTAGDPPRWPARSCAAPGRRPARAAAAAFGNHPHVGDIRGRGLFQAIELVADRATRSPFDPGLKLHARIKAQAHGRGADGLPDGRHHRRPARRPCAAGAALHRRRRATRHDRAAPGARRRCGAGHCPVAATGPRGKPRTQHVALALSLTHLPFATSTGDLQ